MTEEGWREIESVVETHDPDRFVAALFAPAKHRRALITLAAFNHELARIGETVREPMAGHIRLSWWREQLTAIYEGRLPAVPVAEALADAVRTHALPRDLLDRIIEARAHDLDEAPFAAEADHDAYADATGGSLLRLGALILGADAGAAARDAAVAYAYAEHLRTADRLARRRRWRLPVAWLVEERANVEDVFAGTLAVDTRRRIEARVIAAVTAALSAVGATRTPRTITPALVIATLARRPSNPISPWQRTARLALANLTGRV